jgi:hypothetical protein
LCQQIKANNRLLGRVILVLSGDTAQVPPVQGICLWDTMIRRKDVDSLSGMKIYIKDFKTVTLGLYSLETVDTTILQ